jgi:hypothetical protein
MHNMSTRLRYTVTWQTSLLVFLGTQNCGRAAIVSPLMLMVVRKNATCAYLKHRLEANSDEVQTARLCR